MTSEKPSLLKQAAAFIFGGLIVGGLGALSRRDIEIPGLEFLILATFLLPVLFSIGAKVFYFFRERKLLRTRVVSDVSAQNIPIPEKALNVTTQLQNLGFRHIGVTYTPIKTKHSTYTWHFVHPENGVFVEIIYINDMVMGQFNTVYRDRAVLETSFPFGDNLHRKTYYAQKADNMGDAFRQHLEAMMPLELEHGEPVPVQSMNLVLKWDRYHRQQYANIRMDYAVLRGALLDLMVLSFLMGIGMIFLNNPSLSDVQQQVLNVATLVLMIVLPLLIFLLRFTV